MNLLICSIGRHAKIVEDLKNNNVDLKLITTSNNGEVPGAYTSDKNYVVPNVENENYIQKILEICEMENIHAITTMLDVETQVLSDHYHLFEEREILLLVPSSKTAEICLDKFKFYEYVKSKGISTIETYKTEASFRSALENKEINFPIFIKPKVGRGSVGAYKINDYNALAEKLNDSNDLIIQEFIDGKDIDVDVYVDSKSKKAISMFAKEKLEKNLGGATKTKAYYDEQLFNYIEEIVSIFNFSGPINIDVFLKDGKYFVTEINPRLGATYIHTIGSGIDYIPFIRKNVLKEENLKNIFRYSANSVMVTYNSAMIVEL